MADNPQGNRPVDLSSPTAMLAAQTQSLSELVAIQKAQSEQIEGLQQQNERVIGILADSRRDKPASHVKVENINMPFWALVGFLIKLSLASIPAMLIVMMIYGIMVFVLGGLLEGTLGALINGLR